MIESLIAAPCHWVGQSLGSYVGMRLAARRPDLVRSLVMLSPRVRANPRWFVVQVEVPCQAVRAAHALGPAGHGLRRALATYGMRELLGRTSAITGSRVITMAGAGHALLVEQPATVTEAIVDFLDRIDRS